MPLTKIINCVSFIAVLVAGCGGERAETPPAAVTIETATFAPALSVELASMTRTASGLYYRDLVSGEGPEVLAGQATSVRYAGWLPDGTQFDATGPDGPTFTFHPGRGEVIAGWDEGVVGMRVGGRRQLVLPPELGYGPGGSGPIPPNAILVFVVDVIETQ